MNCKMKKAYVEEIQYQTAQINRMKTWLRNLLIVSSILVATIFYLGNSSIIIKLSTYAALVIIVIIIFTINLAIRNASINVKNILNNISLHTKNDE